MGLMDVCDIYGSFCIAKGTGGITSIASILSRIGRTYEKKRICCHWPFHLKSKSRWLLCSPMGFPPRPRCASSFELLGLVIACLWSSWWWRPTSQVQSWCFHVDLWSMLLCHTGPYSSNYWIDLCTCTNLITVQWSSIVFHAISLAERRKERVSQNVCVQIQWPVKTPKVLKCVAFPPICDRHDKPSLQSNLGINWNLLNSGPPTKWWTFERRNR